MNKIPCIVQKLLINAKKRGQSPHSASLAVGHLSLAAAFSFIHWTLLVEFIQLEKFAVPNFHDRLPKSRSLGAT